MSGCLDFLCYEPMGEQDDARKHHLNISWRIIVQGSLSAGLFVAMFTAVNNFMYSVGAIFNSVPQITENGLYAEKVMKILNYQSKINRDSAIVVSENSVRQSFCEIECVNVSFKYPGSDKYVLKNINLKLRSDERLALVGFNGAVKQH